MHIHSRMSMYKRNFLIKMKKKLINILKFGKNLAILSKILRTYIENKNRELIYNKTFLKAEKNQHRKRLSLYY